MASKSCDKAVYEALAKYLKASVPSLKEVLQGFPSADRKLSLPCASILIPAPLYTPLEPYKLEQSATVGNQATVKRVVGMWDYNLQLDLWCGSKPEREELFRSLFAALNPNSDGPQGLSLQLEHHHGVWCRFDPAGHNYDDSEASSQRSEWRVRLNILANTREVSERKEFVIQTIENNLTTPDTIE